MREAARVALIRKCHLLLLLGSCIVSLTFFCLIDLGASSEKLTDPTPWMGGELGKLAVRLNHAMHPR
jgi:hypothetical protein